MKHETLVKLPWKLERNAPHFEGNDIKFPESFARHILKKYSKKGDVVFDPFTGLGTALFVAEEMKRIPFGIEAEEKKYEWVAGQLENWTHLIHDDAANIEKYDFPKTDLILTSPPYMARHHKWNPLFSGNPKHAGYDKYLKRMGFIFGKMTKIMKKNTPLIIQVDNLQNGKIFTPLSRDIAQAISKNYIQADDVKVLWNNPRPDYSYTQYLVFKKKS